MSRENAAAKANRYLVEGRIVLSLVTTLQVKGTARGDGALWRFGYDQGAWWCDCPARSDQCCHLRAARRIVAVTDTPTAPSDVGSDTGHLGEVCG